MVRRSTKVLALAVATLVAVLAITATAGATIFIRDSSQSYKFQPRLIYLAYHALAPPFKITKLRHWHGWGPEPGKARARGWLHYDTCKPNCAEGTYRRVRSKVFLYRVHRCHGRFVYGRITVDPRGLPPHKHRIDCEGYLVT